MAKLAPREMNRLLFGTDALRRFTQCSPVMPDVWLEFNDPKGPEDARDTDKDHQDLLFTPHENSNAGELFKELREQLGGRRGRRAADQWEMAYNGGYVVARLTLEELVRGALPLTPWWTKYLWSESKHKGWKSKP